MPPINGASFPIGATFAPTGGTARSLVTLVNQGAVHKLLVDDGASYALRNTLTVSATESVPNSTYPGGRTPMKRRVAQQMPITLADGSIFVCQVVNEILVHPEATTAQITALRSRGIIAYNDTDMDPFYNTGSTA